jgi:hypothetical protein
VSVSQDGTAGAAAASTGGSSLMQAAYARIVAVHVAAAQVSEQLDNSEIAPVSHAS